MPNAYINRRIVLSGRKKFNPGPFLTAAGITNATQKSAINTLVQRLEPSRLLHNKFHAFYPIIGGTATSHSYNLINPNQFQITWVNTPTQSAQGVDFNGTTQYGRTGLIPSSVMTLNDTALHYYSRDNVAVSTIDLGAINAAVTNLFRLIIRSAGDEFISDQYDGTGGRLIATGVTDSRGLFTTTKTASSHDAYRNGASIGTDPTSGGALPDVELYIGCQNLGGSPGAFGQRQCAFFAIGKALTASEAALLYTAIQEYQTTLGRQV